MTRKRDLIDAARDPLASKPGVFQNLEPSRPKSGQVKKLLGCVGIFALGLVAGVALARLKL